jgi:hypothetical protein
MPSTISPVCFWPIPYGIFLLKYYVYSVPNFNLHVIETKKICPISKAFEEKSRIQIRVRIRTNTYESGSLFLMHVLYRLRIRIRINLSC